MPKQMINPIFLIELLYCNVTAKQTNRHIITSCVILQVNKLIYFTAV